MNRVKKYRPRLMVFVTLAAAASLLACVESADGIYPTRDSTQGAVHPELTLRRLTAVELPDGFAASGISIGLQDGVLIWSRESAHGYLLEDDLTWTRVELHAQEPVAVQLQATRPVFQASVLDAATRSLLQVSGSGAEPQGAALDPSPIEAASWIPGRGWALLRVSADSLRLSYLDGQNQESPGRVFPWTSKGGAHLSPGHGRALVISEIRWPNRVGFFDGLTNRLAFPDSIRSRSPEDSSSMVALPTLRVPSGYVQVLADQTSLRRFVRRFNIDGILENESVLEGVPFGLVAARPDDATLFGVQTIEKPELVIYRAEVGPDPPIG